MFSKITILVCLFLMPFASCSANDAAVSEAKLFQRLDSYLERREEFSKRKEESIANLKKKLYNATTEQEQLWLLNRICKEYYTYRYDSAMHYVNLGLELAQKVNDKYYIQLNTINRISVLSTGGFYSQSAALLESLPEESVMESLRFDYYYTKTWLYNYWSAYCSDSEFEKELHEKKKECLRQTLLHFKKEPVALNFYLMAELEQCQRHTSAKVLKYYKLAYDASNLNTRVHASSAYGLARYYKETGNMNLYEKYIVEAAISDQVCPLKENLALQEFSTYLYNKDVGYAKRAIKYINFSMEDAQFYNNRLRLVEISRILPTIASTSYKAEMQQTRIFIASTVIISLMAISVLALAVFAFRQNKRLAVSRKEVRLKNKSLEELNDSLEQLNERLVKTNTRREVYMKLFLDISAVYIQKLNDVRKMVTRKIKAKQTADLLAALDNYKLTEEETSNFYFYFDRAFLDLYPNFVSEFNTLLLPDKPILQSSANSLPKELRIYALMRLGVTDGQKIATLLFYSTQTIYNYKAAVKKRAINSDTFDEEVNHLCNLI